MAETDPLEFFRRSYFALREQPPMWWMERLFLQITGGQCRKLVDLPTGAGKTDVAVIWVLALAWYGLDTGKRSPVPRRLVWVVNRRVLVQQVFRLARRLQEKLFVGGADPASLADVREGLARLSGDDANVFGVVELRGQLIDDRKWSVAPTMPQLIIGTVDQIGSRLLFQGYGLGKWSRPMQAALMSVDAWICVDEAHLVPAFVLTLRQVRRLIANEGQSAPWALSPVFDRLPFWTTELSATPALPPPSEDAVFRLQPIDEDDPQLEDRLLAAQTRKVRIRWLAEAEKPEEALGKAAAELIGEVGAVAVFVREPKAANKIAAGLKKLFKKGDRVLLITGRLRGYERDRLEKQEVLKRLGPPEHGDQGNDKKETVFLVGTAAAEVGLDADAAAVLCDFASLPTLLQRLGRLDRRGNLSRRFQANDGEAPTMTVFAKRREIGPDIEARVMKLGQELSAENDDLTAALLVGKHWKEATTKIGGHQPGEAEIEKPEEDDRKAKVVEPRHLVDAATWDVLLGEGQDRPDAETLFAEPPRTWLNHSLARVTGGPVSVPPLTAALIEHWSATTDPRNTFLPVHPFLYGILPDPEGTPLMSVAFRLEMDALVTACTDDEEDELQGQALETQVGEIFRQFPPRRAEFHFIALSAAKEWFSSTAIPVALFDGEEWSVAKEHKDKRLLRPGTLLVLPTLAHVRADLSKLLEGVNDAKASDTASRDVLEGVSTPHALYRRRVVPPAEPGDYGLNCVDGAARVVPVNNAEESRSVPYPDSVGEPPAGTTWQTQPWVLKIGTATFRFEYLKLLRQVQPRQSLDEHGTRAEGDAERIACALAPDNEFLRSLLVEAAKVHDEGKRNCKWQRAMGNPDCANPVAKPLVERPARLGGFRHEWESLLRMRTCSPGVPDPLSETDVQQWLDLWSHLVASHHGHLRPWLSDNGFAPEIGKRKQSTLRLDSAERFARLQRLLGPWRLAYMEALMKSADVAASSAEEERTDEQ